MTGKRYCKRCGCQLLVKKAPPEIAEKVKLLTGQQDVWLYLCPECYPEKVKDFLSHKKFLRK
jgi:uncharacterized protein with PIN domain